MNRQFNQDLINKIAELIPKKQNQLSMLMDILHIGKESAYRRLRGDVSFSLSEACQISHKLGISLDSICDSGEDSRLFFELQDKTNENLEELYAKRIDSFFYSFLRNVETSNFIDVYCAFNTIPDSFLFLYENLSKLQFFKWLYQIRYKTIDIKFSDLVIPEDLLRKQRIVGRGISSLRKNIFVFDRNIFISFIKEIKYFHSLDLISKEDLKVIQEEMLLFLDEIENTFMIGRNEGGTKIEAYLSNIDFDGNYTHIKGENFEQAYIDYIYLTNTLISSDPNICKMHSIWIESLRKYSTLISISGEMERRKFFRHQREIWKKL